MTDMISRAPHAAAHAAGEPCETCATLIARAIGRRRLLAIGAGGLAALLPGLSAAQPAPATTYEAMLLMCIDPRLIRYCGTYMDRRGLTDKYSQFAIAGAAAAVVAPRFAAWRQTFWDNLASTIQLHSIKAVIALNHRDCGAVRLAYGAEPMSTPEKETSLHRQIFAKFRRDVTQHHRTLRVETMLMALDGTVTEIT
jgi:carbonic anhydrase